MNYTERTVIVDVVKISASSFKLSIPAGELFALCAKGNVMRRNDLSTPAVPKIEYTPLTEVKLQSGTYSFTFASGDVFTASSADAYPAAASVSDAPSAQTIVNFTNDGTQWSADKTFDEVLALLESGASVIGAAVSGSTTNILVPVAYSRGDGGSIWFVQAAIAVDDDEAYLKEIRMYASGVAAYEQVYNFYTLREE